MSDELRERIAELASEVAENEALLASFESGADELVVFKRGGMYPDWRGGVSFDDVLAFLGRVSRRSST